VQSRLSVAAKRLRIGLTYWWRHGRWPSLDRPRLFTELVQVRKLSDRDPRMPLLADKVAVKAFVAARLGAEWITPTLWQGSVLPRVAPWPAPFVVKARHGCRQNAFVRGESDDWDAVRRRARGWSARHYGRWLDEWSYRNIPRGLLVEPMIGGAHVPPVDYKFFVFGGAVAYVQVHVGRGSRHRWIVLDPQWRRVSAATRDPDPARPASLDRMIAAAETLAQGFDFVRCDFYEDDGKPLFGELTFYPGSGLDPFDPPALDRQMGARWLAAQAPVSRPPTPTATPIRSGSLEVAAA
jgi:hypothetical protein